MPRCVNCGKELAPEDRFCSACGATLTPEPYAPVELRKTVTVIFTDIAESTRLGERLDPESLRRVISRYHDEMRAALAQYGGVVHKLMGDAVMVVFGIPTVHEDDALRAVVAAAGMQSALGKLNAELEDRWG